jgi:hypothetical protein
MREEVERPEKLIDINALPLNYVIGAKVVAVTLWRSGV